MHQNDAIFRQFPNQCAKPNNVLSFISIEKGINDDSLQNEKNFLYYSSINKIGNKNEKELREKIEKNENINNIYNLIEENENNKKIIDDLKNKINEKEEIIKIIYKKSKEESMKEKIYYEQKIKSLIESNKFLEYKYNELDERYKNLIKENNINKKKIKKYQKVINKYKIEIENTKLKDNEGKEIYEKKIKEVLSEKYENMMKLKINKIITENLILQPNL